MCFFTTVPRHFGIWDVKSLVSEGLTAPKPCVQLCASLCDMCLLQLEEQKYHTCPSVCMCIRHQEQTTWAASIDRTPVFCVGSLVRDGDAPSSVLGAARPSSRCSARGLRAALAPAGSPWKDFFPPGWRPCERCGGRAAELAKSTWFQSCEATVSVLRNFRHNYTHSLHTYLAHCLPC